MKNLKWKLLNATRKRAESLQGNWNYRDDNHKYGRVCGMYEGINESAGWSKVNLDQEIELCVREGKEGEIKKYFEERIKMPIKLVEELDLQFGICGFNIRRGGRDSRGMNPTKVEF